MQMINVPVLPSPTQVILVSYLGILQVASKRNKYSKLFTLSSLGSGQLDLIALHASASYAEFLTSLALTADFNEPRKALKRACAWSEC